MKNKIKQFLISEEGQTSTEYILLVAVVALIVLKFRKIATEKLTNLTNKVFDNATNSIEGGFSE